MSLVVYTTDLAGWRASLAPIGRVWRRHFGRHFPAMALFGVTELFDPAAPVELVATAVVPGPAVGEQTSDEVGWGYDGVKPSLTAGEPPAWSLA